MQKTTLNSMLDTHQPAFWLRGSGVVVIRIADYASKHVEVSR